MYRRVAMKALCCLLAAAGLILPLRLRGRVLAEQQGGFFQPDVLAGEAGTEEDEWAEDDWAEDEWEDIEETEWDESFWEDEEEPEEDDSLKGKTYGPLGSEDGTAVETHVCGDYVYTFNADGRTVRTVSYRGGDTEVAVPGQLDGHPVTAVGEFTFQGREDLVSAVLPEGVTEIGNMAFFKCAALTSVSIPEGVTLLDQACFGGCGALKEVSLPDSLETIGDFAFLACASLQEIVCGPHVRRIGQGAFQMCASLTSATLPAALTEIGQDAFADCPSELEIVKAEPKP